MDENDGKEKKKSKIKVKENKIDLAIYKFAARIVLNSDKKTSSSKMSVRPEHDYDWYRLQEDSTAATAISGDRP